MKPKTILAFDPGLRELGYAVLQGRSLVAVGVLALRLLPKDRRLAEARARMRLLLKTHRPAAVVVEKTYRHPVPWLDGLHQVAVVARRLARERCTAFAAYAPQRVRQHVLGDGRATKAEVAVAIAHRYPQLRVFLTQDRKWKVRHWQNMFDAVALALHHAKSRPPSRGR